MAELASFVYPDLKYVWLITDASNTLQGLLIFIIFVCKKRILRLLKLKFGSKDSSTNSSMKTPSKSSNAFTRQTSVVSNDNVKMRMIPMEPTANN